MVTPVRVQRKRAKGWQMPPHTKAVDRSTAFGNFAADYREVGRLEAVARFRQTFHGSTTEALDRREWIRKELKGWNLACWCPLVDKDGKIVPCHADVLLEIANAQEESQS